MKWVNIWEYQIGLQNAEQEQMTVERAWESLRDYWQSEAGGTCAVVEVQKVNALKLHGDPYIVTYTVNDAKVTQAIPAKLALELLGHNLVGRILSKRVVWFICSPSEVAEAIVIDTG